jgi:hypothetical protein
LREFGCFLPTFGTVSTEMKRTHLIFSTIAYAKINKVAYLILIHRSPFAYINLGV